MKKFTLLLALLVKGSTAFSQALFSSSFNTLALQTYTASGPTSYTTVPAPFTLINDWRNNNIGSSTNPNAPFQVPALKTTGWAVLYNQAENDTFLVSTSWLDTTGINVDRWAITPAISGIGPNTVLTWLAKSPDPSYPEGYEVYGTTNLNPSLATDFAVGDRLFAVADGNTPGGGESSSWTRRSVFLGSFAGQTLRFAFRDNSKDMYQVWIDDIEVVSPALATDAALTSVQATKYVMTGSSNTIQVNVQNVGAVNISTVTLNYNINNSTINTETFSFSDLAYGQSRSIAFGLPYSLSSPGLYTIKSWISAVNGGISPNLVNDTAVYYVTVQSTAPARTVLLEQFVSANDGVGPDAQEKTNALSGSAIIVNIHAGDSLKEAGSAGLLNDYKKHYGTALVDRCYFNDLGGTQVAGNDYATYIGARQSQVSPVSVSIINKTYNAATRQLSFDVKAEFAGTVKGDYRINAYLTENHVCGAYYDLVPNGYNQLNGFYNTSWSPYYQQGYYFPAAGYVLNALQFKHQNALTHSFDGSYGSAGTIPASVTQGQTFQQTFTYTIPTPANVNVHEYNPDNIYVVGFVAEYSADKNQRTVLNAAKAKVNDNSEMVGIKDNTLASGGSVYPNPSTGLVYFSVSEQVSNYDVNVYDLLGHCLKIQSGVKAKSMDLTDLAPGVYLLKFNSAQGSFTEKIVIQKN